MQKLNRRKFILGFSAILGLTSATLLSGCGGGSKSGPKSFLKDVTGVWAGTAGTVAGGAPASMNLDQGRSDLITGSITLFGVTTAIAGEKNANAITLTGSAGPSRFVAELVLVSETEMNGSIAQITNNITTNLTASFTKS